LLNRLKTKSNPVLLLLSTTPAV